MAYLRPGVYIEETLNPIPPLAGPDANSIAAFVGAASFVWIALIALFALFALIGFPHSF